MFVTRPELALWVPPGISAPGENYWSAVVLGVELPWFLLTTRHREGSAWIGQTIAVAWESTLRQLIETSEPGCVLALNVMTRVRGKASRWQMLDVTELWIPSVEEAADRGPLLYSFADGSGIVDSHGHSVEEVLPGRKLLAKLTVPG